MDIFTKIDSYKKTFLGFNPLGALQNIRVWRKYILFLTLLSLFSWMFFGWESTWTQPFTFLKNIPSLLLGQTTLTETYTQALTHYGLGQHLSSAVIYGFSFFFLSIHLEKINIKKSLNFFLTASFSFMSIGLYEVIYNLLYSTLQNQSWTFTFAWKQGLNITIFIFFIILGALSFLYTYSLNYKPNFSKYTKFFLLLSILTYLLWVFYPFPTTTLTVDNWSSTPFFPQTMYAVGPIDGIAIGEPFFVPNNLLHLINVLNKTFMALTVLSLSFLKKKL